MQSKINGTTLPVLEIILEPGEKIVAETGALSWMTDPVAMHTTTATGGARGIWGAVTRAIGGGGLFMTEFSAERERGMVAFAAKVPGQILPLEIGGGRSYMVHRHGFLCGTEGIELSMGFQQSLGAGIFGGNGFVLQKLAGSGSAWVELGGEIVTYDLPAGASLRVHPGHVGMFEDSVTFEITLVRGIRNALFGGDGLFLARLTGPGKIWLQTLTMPNLAHSLTPYLDREGSNAGGAAAAVIGTGVASAVFNGIFGGDRDDT
jgi:uncharacterized protein (TIGR00266 family)